MTAPGRIAILDLVPRPAGRLTIAGHEVVGPRLGHARVPGRPSFGGERLAAIEGVVALKRPGIAAVQRLATGVAATVGAGFRIDRGWAGRSLRHLEARRGVGPFEPVATLAEPGVVPDRVVRRSPGRTAPGSSTCA